jgi:hypothetical protein
MKIIRIIEQKLKRFLWSGKDSKAKAKVSWANICLPKKEGGLGIKQLEVWNRAAMLNHIWKLVYLIRLFMGGLGGGNLT